MKAGGNKTDATCQKRQSSLLAVEGFFYQYPPVSKTESFSLERGDYYTIGRTTLFNGWTQRYWYPPHTRHTPAVAVTYSHPVTLQNKNQYVLQVGAKNITSYDISDRFPTHHYEQFYLALYDDKGNEMLRLDDQNCTKSFDQSVLSLMEEAVVKAGL